MVFEAPGLARALRTLHLRDGETLALEDVVLTRGRAVSGRVVDARTGAPVSGALVFDVPPKTRFTRLVVHDTPLSAGTPLTLNGG